MPRGRDRYLRRRMMDRRERYGDRNKYPMDYRYGDSEYTSRNDFRRDRHYPYEYDMDYQQSRQRSYDYDYDRDYEMRNDYARGRNRGPEYNKDDDYRYDRRYDMRRDMREDYRRNRRADYDDYRDYADEDYGKEYKEDLMHWIEKLKKNDRFNIPKEQLIKRAEEMGVKFDEYDENEFYAIYLMHINDYPFIANEPNTYLAMAKAWLEDKDLKIEPSEKVCKYMYEIAMAEE